MRLLPPLGSRPRPSAKPGRPAALRFRPALEGLEDRTVPAAVSLTAAADLGPAFAAEARASSGSEGEGRGSGLRLEITDVAIEQGEGGQVTLAVEGSLGGQAFARTVELAVTPDADGDGCATLNLDLGELDLDLSGLSLDTSAICVDVTGDPDEGGDGELLCGLADGLAAGQTLDQILEQLDALPDDSSEDPDDSEEYDCEDHDGGDGGASGDDGDGGLDAEARLEAALEKALDGAIDVVADGLKDPGAVTAATSTSLSLELEPARLDLSGMTVDVYNCDEEGVPAEERDDPIAVDVTVQADSAKVEKLLNSIAAALDGDADDGVLARKLAKLSRALNRLA